MSLVIISDNSAAFDKARNETVQRHNVTTRIVELLWTDGQVMDSFRRNGRGWQGTVASRIGVTREDLSTFIEATGGLRRLRDVVFGNPAGPAPHAVELKKIPAHMTSSYGCPTSGCATSGCATSGCGTAHCGTYACGELKPSAPKLEAA